MSRSTGSGMQLHFAASVIALIALMALGCGKEGASDNISPAARSEAQQLFAARCTACHGEQGQGDGPAAASLSPKPANFKDRTWQANIQDAAIEKAIAAGGVAVGKSAAMPPNPDLAEKPELLAALRAHVRSFKP